MDPGAKPPDPWSLRERNARVVTAERPTKRKAPFIPPEDIIELTDSSDDESIRPRKLSTTFNASLPRIEPLFLPASDDDEPKNVPPPAPVARSEGSNAPAMNTVDAYVAQVLEIIPDVEPLHVTGLVQRYKENVLEQVLHLLFENPDYPRATDKGKGKRKRNEKDEALQASPPPSKIVKIDYASKDRQRLGGAFYDELSIEQLRANFPLTPMSHIRHAFSRHGRLYAPTYLALETELKSGQPPYQRLLSASRNKLKGKQAARVDPELEKEKQWIRARSHEAQSQTQAMNDAQMAALLQVEEDTVCMIECGCCFSEYPFIKMIQCPEAHLFCMSCVSTYASGKLGEHDVNIVCMDQSGCKLPFPESELRRFLTPKLLELYERVKQRKEIEAAGLENLEECPFCEYKVVIDNEHEKLFRCEREECSAISCRACKKLDHLPKSCKEAEEDKKLDGRHTVEEAMTRALLRNCPNCNKAFMKESGCNKMTCPNCRTLSCYVCRKVITGYEHFDQRPATEHRTDSTKCVLWDSVEKRHADEVTAAAKKAMEEYKQAHPEVHEKDLDVELPKPVAGPSHLAAGGHVPGPGGHINPPPYIQPLVNPFGPDVPFPVIGGRDHQRLQARYEAQARNIEQRVANARAHYHAQMAPQALPPLPVDPYLHRPRVRVAAKKRR